MNKYINHKTESGEDLHQKGNTQFRNKTIPCI